MNDIPRKSNQANISSQETIQTEAFSLTAKKYFRVLIIVYLQLNHILEMREVQSRKRYAVLIIKYNNLILYLFEYINVQIFSSVCSKFILC